MTWYGARQQSLTFSGEDGQVMKDKLIALIDRELSKKRTSQKDILWVKLNKNSEGKASTTHINEGMNNYTIKSIPIPLSSSKMKITEGKLNNIDAHIKQLEKELIDKTSKLTNDLNQDRNLPIGSRFVR